MIQQKSDCNYGKDLNVQTDTSNGLKGCSTITLNWLCLWKGSENE